MTSEGAAVHNAPVWNTRGFTGAGVKVGVVDAGFVGYGALMGTELPSAVVARCYTGVATFTSDLSDCETNGVHGTAVAEAIADIAPGVSLYVVNPFSSGDLLASVQWLVSQGVDVLNMSLAFVWDGPGDGTSLYSDSPLVAVDTAVSGGIVWANSAGNAAMTSWYGGYINQDSDGFLEFQTTSAVEVNQVSLSADERLTAQLRWDDSWGSATRDFDLLLYDDSLNLVDFSASLQSGQSGQDPYERLSYTAPSSGQYNLAIFHVGGAAPAWLQLTAFTQQTLSISVAARSVENPAESANMGLLAVGAASWSTTSTIESFSSRGPTIDGRVKPDIVGADRGNSVSYGFFAFSGTSQASPHVAGLAALVVEQFPSFTPTQVADYLKTNALPRGAVPNNTWGYGLAQLPPLTPGPPTGVTAVRGAAQATVSWNAPTADGGNAVTGYTVTSNPGGQTAAVGSTPLNATVSGLTNGQSYTFTVTASNTVGQSAASTPSSGVAPVPVVSINPTSNAVEGDAGATNSAGLVASLSSASVAIVSLTYDTVDGGATASSGDYTAVTGGTLTIPAGNVTGTVQIVSGDDIYELDETFIVVVTTSTNSTINPAASTTVVTILNDDPLPALSIVVAAVPEGGTVLGEGNVRISYGLMTLAGKTALSSSFTFTIADTSTSLAAVAGSDYQSTTVFSGFGANTSTDTTSAIFEIRTLEDNVDEFDESFLVRLFDVKTATVAVSESLVTILDNDPTPSLSVLNETANETDGTANVTVTLSGASSGGVSVDVTTQGLVAVAGIDYVSTTATLTWAPDESGDKVFVVPLINNANVTGPRLVTVALVNARTDAASAEGVVVGNGFGVLKIIDDEAPQITEIPGLTPLGLVAVAVGVGVLLRRRLRAFGREPPSQSSPGGG